MVTEFLPVCDHEAPGQKIVAVVGAGHVEGMTKLFGQKIDRAPLEVLPPPLELLLPPPLELLLLLFVSSKYYTDLVLLCN